MLKIVALTSGQNVPSARFRVRQYLPYLRAAGIVVKEYCPNISQTARLPGLLGRIRGRYLPIVSLGQIIMNLCFRIPGILGSYSANVTWLERNFIPGLDDLAIILKKPMVIDIDDAIWLYNPFGKSIIKRLLKQADMVFAGNMFIADWCSNYCSNVQIIPTAIDTNRFKPCLKPKSKDLPFVVGWTGTSSNFRFLKMIEPALAKFFSNNLSARLLIVADKTPDLTSVPINRVEFIPWSADTEHIVLQKMDVGIMPIDDTELTRGKCSFKILQYMATGLPVIASPYGMNSQIFSLGKIGLSAISIDEWYEALKFFAYDEKLRQNYGYIGRSITEKSYALDIIVHKICRLFYSYFG